MHVSRKKFCIYKDVHTAKPLSGMLTTIPNGFRGVQPCRNGVGVYENHIIIVALYRAGKTASDIFSLLTVVY